MVSLSKPNAGWSCPGAVGTEALLQRTRLLAENRVSVFGRSVAHAELRSRGLSDNPRAGGHAPNRHRNGDPRQRILRPNQGDRDEERTPAAESRGRDEGVQPDTHHVLIEDP